MVIRRDRMLLTAIAIVLAISGRTTVSAAQACRTRSDAPAEGAPCVTRTSAESSSARPPRNLATVFVPPRPFNVLVLGDSYMWEPGLRMEEKSFWLVWQHIAAELGGFRAATRPRV